MNVLDLILKPPEPTTKHYFLPGRMYYDFKAHGKPQVVIRQVIPKVYTGKDPSIDKVLHLLKHPNKEPTVQVEEEEEMDDIFADVGHDYGQETVQPDPTRHSPQVETNPEATLERDVQGQVDKFFEKLNQSEMKLERFESISYDYQDDSEEEEEEIKSKSKKQKLTNEFHQLSNKYQEMYGKKL